jgi:hypothetical protein
MRFDKRLEEMSGTFNAATIDAEYQRLGGLKGWTFLACPEARVETAKTAIVGLNPGGGGDADVYAYGGVWDVPQGNAYFVEHWGPNGTDTPVQTQVKAWHRLLELGPDDTLCAQFVPFRSPDWERLGPRKAEALTFARELWRWLLARAAASTFVTMGYTAGEELSKLIGATRSKEFDTGWGTCKIMLNVAPDGRRVVALPHPSRYQLFGRADGKSSVAEQSLRKAVGL